MSKHNGMLTTSFDHETARRQELAAFLRSARERVSPKKPGPRRRTPGLRREEVADAACISVTWYTWLEQGRDVSMSADTMRRLAAALHLDVTQENYLRGLARPVEALAPVAHEAVPETLVTLVAGLDPHPAYATDRVSNVVAWNRAAGRLLGEFIPGDPVKGNILARLFLDADWKRLFVRWPEIAASAVAQFRASTAAFARDEDVIALASRLMTHAPEFAAVWSATELAQSPDWTKEILTPRGDVETWRYSLLRPEGESRDFTVAVYFKT